MPRPLHAEPESPDARQLDEQGTRDMDAGDYAAACPKLADSYRAEPGTGVLLRLALCYERAGQSASAWSRYREAAELGRKDSNHGIEELAERRASALEPRLVKVVLRVSRVPDLELTLDGEPLPEAEWAHARPVDPGRHELVATAPGMRRFTRWFTSTTTTAPAVVSVVLEPEEPTPARAPSPSRPPVEHPPESPQVGWTFQHTAAVTLGLLGVAGLVTGSISGGAAIGDMNAARDQCPTHRYCSTQALSLQDDARREATVATIGFSAGGGLAAAAVALWFTAPKDEGASQTAWRVAPYVDARARGLFAARSF